MLHVFITLVFGVLTYWLARLTVLRQLGALQTNLKTVEHDRSMLLTELDERFKDNLQMIISLANLEARRVDRSLTTCRKAFKDLQGRFGAMAIVQRALSHRRATDTVCASPLIEELINQQLAESADPIECKVETNNLDISVMQAGPLGLILHEISGQAVSRGGSIRDRRLGLELGEKNGVQLLDVKLYFDGEFTDTDAAEYALSDDIIEMLSGQIAVELSIQERPMWLHWRLSFAK